MHRSVFIFLSWPLTILLLIIILTITIIIVIVINNIFIYNMYYVPMIAVIVSMSIFSILVTTS